MDHGLNLMLLCLVVQGSKIQATILGRSLCDRLGGVFREGDTYFIANFEVTKKSWGLSDKASIFTWSVICCFVSGQKY